MELNSGNSHVKNSAPHILTDTGSPGFVVSTRMLRCARNDVRNGRDDNRKSVTFILQRVVKISCGPFLYSGHFQ